MKTVLIVRAAPRKKGITNLFADAFVRGLHSADASVEIAQFDAAENPVAPCRGCYACVKTSACAINDDFSKTLELVGKCDVLAVFTPVYFCTMSAQLKAFFDRCFPLAAARRAADTAQNSDTEKPTRQNRKMLAFSCASGRLDAFEAITKNFELVAAELGFGLSANVRRGEAVYFSELGEKSVRVKKILAAAEKLGRETALGVPSPETIAEVEAQIAPDDATFYRRAKTYWRLLKSRGK